MKVTKQHETAYGTTIFISHPTRRYFDEFVRLKCAPDLLAAKVFPNSKEITETMTAFNAVRKMTKPKRFADPTVTLLDVGSGSTPRTAAYFACMTRWQCIAVDPQLRESGAHRIQRVRQYQCRIEDMAIKVDGLLVIVCVHSHASMKSVMKAVQAPEMIVVAMPCCTRLNIPDAEPLWEYEDAGCWSPERTVKIWDFRKGTHDQSNSPR